MFDKIYKLASKYEAVTKKVAQDFNIELGQVQIETPDFFVKQELEKLANNFPNVSLIDAATNGNTIDVTVRFSSFVDTNQRERVIKLLENHLNNKLMKSSHNKFVAKVSAL